MEKKKKHKWKYQINIKKKILVLVILGVSLFVGLGYAILGTNLVMSGSLQVAKREPTLYAVFQREAVDNYALKYGGDHQDSMNPAKSTQDVYHFYASTASRGNDILEKNNVVFANTCWQMIRTTDTGGVKLLYNGEVETTEADGVTYYNCGDTRNYYHMSSIQATSAQSFYNNREYIFAKNYTATTSGTTTTFTLVDDPNDPDDYKAITMTTANAATDIADIAANYPYYCSNRSSSCSNGNFYKVISQNGTGLSAYVYAPVTRDIIGSTGFSLNNGSASNAGYMYGDTYQYQSNLTGTLNQNLITSSYSFVTGYTTFANTYMYSKTLNPTGTNTVYELDNPILGSDIETSPDYSGYYTYRSPTTVSGSSPYYIVGLRSGTSYHYIALTSNKTLADYNVVIGSTLEDNGDNTYTVKNGENPATVVTVDDWFANYANYNSMYTCLSTNDTCANPKYIYSTSNTGFGYISASDKIAISTEVNGLQLSGDVKTITQDEWYRGYNSTYANYYYTCGNTDTTCTKTNLRYITYRTGTNYRYAVNRYYGASVIYEDNVYKLQNTIPLQNVTDNTALSTHHYTCVDLGETECASVAYVYRSGTNNGLINMSYILLNDPQVTSIETALNNMLTKNTNSSNVKNYIDAWYESNLKNTIYEAKLDDVIYCNDRSYSTQNGYTFANSAFNANGGTMNASIYFRGNNIRDDLSCPNVKDRFSVSNNDAKLTYKIGLPTDAELYLLNQNNARKSISTYMTMTPQSYIDSVALRYVMTSGSISTFNSSSGTGVRPVISLVKGTTYSQGNGTKTNPYVVNMSE